MRAQDHGVAVLEEVPRLAARQRDRLLAARRQLEQRAALARQRARLRAAAEQVTRAQVAAIARVVRSVVLDLKTREFVEAARMIGASNSRIMLREILPNLFDTLLVEAAIYFGYGILVGSGLGFLGMGVQPPSPDWGLLVSDGRNFLLTAPWVVISPALAISSLVIGVNLLADGLNQK